jgi:sugar O-acyltransferase (sialic acid O-acetyltransferase NeuD family)
MSIPSLAVYGASGHAKVVIDIAERQGNYSIEFLVDDAQHLWGQSLYGYSVIGGREKFQKKLQQNHKLECVIAVGNNQTRETIASDLLSMRVTLSAPLIHPSAQMSRGVIIGEGSVLMAFSAINSDSTLGKNVIVNTGATIDHDCVIGDSAHIAPGATLCGGISIGAGTLVGAGAVILPNLRIGKNVIVGAGSTVLENVPDNVTVVGSPARKIFPHVNS